MNLAKDSNSKELAVVANVLGPSLFGLMVFQDVNRMINPYAPPTSNTTLPVDSRDTIKARVSRSPTKTPDTFVDSLC